MKHPRYIIVTIVINIALIMLFTILHEYTSLSERYNQLGNNVKQAVNLALDSSIASEEMFSEQYRKNITDKMLSAGTTQDNDRDLAANESSSTLVCINGDFVHANVYTLARVYEDKGHMPTSVGDYSSRASDSKYCGTEFIYSWLYGQVAGFGQPNRAANTEFKSFYDNIGKKIEVSEIFQKQNLDITVQSHPVLENMGLLLDDGNIVGEEYTNVNTLSVRKVGKWESLANIKGTEYSYYYLTPNSLGVTYVPLKVFTPNFIANLDTIIRLQRLASGSGNTNSSSLLQMADGCVDTKVYVKGTDHVTHSDGGHRIINDGTCEYDLDEVYSRVDYFLVDFYDTKNKDIVANIEGSITGTNMTQDTALTNTVNSLKKSDTANTSVGQKKDSNRIVAKVTVRIKVNIPYESSLLQWLSYKDYMAHGGNGTWHASVKNYNPSVGQVIRDGDGTWFQYSTYTAVTR